jgi:peptidoglycan/xylan/chitin deacetylase (PgdA/CDA1 family)
MYHRVEPRHGDPVREFTPPLSCNAFARQLEHLGRHYRVVAAADIQDEARRRRRGARVPVAITFDDDTRSHLRWAAPLLAERGFTATFFLNGIALDAPCAYWWERLQSAHDQGRDWADLLPPEVLAEAWSIRRDGGPLDAYAVTEAVERMTPNARRALSEALREMLGGDPPDAGLRAADVRALAAEGFTIGFHGHNHEPMSQLHDMSLDRELDGGRRELSRASGQHLTAIAYPHGKADRTVARAARARGWKVGFTGAPEAVTDVSDPLLLGRVDGWAPSVGIFAASLVRALRGAPGRS